MIYFLLFIYIYLYLFIIRIKSENKVKFIVYFFPISTLLVLILGLQYNVGTDYFSYLHLASGNSGLKFITNHYEYLFAFLVRFVRYFKEPQLIFLFSAIIQISFFTLIVYELKKMKFKLHIFFFLYFTLMLIFFNQFNGIRQYISVYIIIYALFKLINSKKIIFITLVFLASLFHISSLIFLIFLILNPLLKMKFSKYKIIIIICSFILISLYDFSNIYIKIIKYLPFYNNYIHSTYFGRLSLQGIITKIPKLIIVISSIYFIDHSKLSKKETYLINLSYISIITLVMSFTSTLIWRFYHYLDFFLIIPVLLLFHNKKYKKLRLLFGLILLFMFITKVILIPRGEYLYRWIIF